MKKLLLNKIKPNLFPLLRGLGACLFTVKQGFNPQNCLSNIYRFSVTQYSVSLLLLFLVLTNNVFSQKEDYNWIFGQFDDSRNVFQWDNDLNIVKDTVPTNLGFFSINSSISRDNKLLFYTNGRKIYSGINHQLIENGDSIGFGYVWSNYNFYEVLIHQGTLALNDLSNENNYILFSLLMDTIMNDSVLMVKNIGCRGLLESKINVYDENIKIVYKNKIIIQDTLFTGGLTSCRHANGRDWWIITHEALNNCTNVILYTPDTLFVFNKNCEGFVNPYNGLGESKFSNDGTKLIQSNALNGLKIFDFNRCTGYLNLKETISRDNLMLSTDLNVNYVGNFVISSNSRYLYTGPLDSLFRFDLNSQNILESKELVRGIHPDSIYSPKLIPTNIGLDGKLYAHHGSLNFINVINNPNAENVNNLNIELEVPLPKKGSQSFGNFPNYRLGRLIGSPCDTLYNSIEETLTELKVLEAYPNPANNKIRIDYAGKFWEKVNNLHLKITDILGQEFYNKKLPEYSARQTIDLKKYPKGVYFVYLVDEGKVLGTLRIIKN